MRATIRLLGGFDVVIDGRTVPDDTWRRRQAASLVKLLCLQPGRRMLREQVIDALWPDEDPDDAAPRLHKAAHYARRALGPDSLVLARDVVALLPHADVVVDLDLFDAAVASARADGGAAGVERAIDVYRGDLLPDDLYEAWTEEARDRRRLQHLALLREAGRWQDILVADPTDEDAHLHVAEGLMERGDRSGALRQLHAMEEILRRELGVGPSDAASALRATVEAMPVHDDSPTPRGARGPTPLPRPPTTTIGREAEIDRIIALLERSRVVTLLGPGGVGKTRLAVEAALRRSRLAEIDACFVDLTTLGDAELVPELIGREIGITVPAVGGAQALEEALRGRSLLIVLDNVEHVIDAAAIVGLMAGWSSGVEVLSTSRARLQVPGEQVFDVAPLPVDVAEASAGSANGISPAEALFEQVATAVDPTFTLADVREDVRAICRQVDGLPLAIELAAGHVRTLPPALLRPRLAIALRSPLGAARGTHPRQQTMSATIDWSLELLAPSERRLFASLGVFSSAVPIEAIEQVCGHDAGDLLPGLARLVDQSLVRRVGGGVDGPRFGQLELLRERARHLLTPAERDRLGRRHARWVAGVLDDIDEQRWTEAAGRWIARIAELMPEIRAAHAWASGYGEPLVAARITADLGTYWHREGHHAEGRQWVAAALASQEDWAAGATDDALSLTARLRIAAGFVEWPTDQVVAREHWVTATEQFRALGDDRFIAYSLALTSGTYIGDDGCYDFAIRLCDESISLARAVGDLPLIAQALNIAGELARVHGDDDLALAVYEEGMALAAQAGDEAHLSVFLANLAYLAVHRGDHVEARRLGCEALALCWSLGRRMMAAWTVSELAGPELGLGRPERGARMVGAADQALLTLGATRHPGDTPEHERVVTDLVAALGRDRFEELWAEGAQLSLGEAVDLALNEPKDETTPIGI